jgi:ABC-type nitrate/sulfonate/bicarbonate transport system ATPase subunit
MGSDRSFERAAFFPLFLLHGAPPLLWITPLVLWLGTEGMAPPIVAFLVTVPLLTSHVVEARKTIKTYDFEVFTIYSRKRSVYFKELYLPKLLPAIKSNIQIGFLIAIKAVMVAEWFAAQNGFGRKLNNYYQFFNLQGFFTWALLFLLCLGGIAILLKFLMTKLLPDIRETMLINEQGEVLSPPVSQTLEARNISFGYKNHKIFENFSLRLEPGKPLVLYGPSGCGKTTLLKTLSGLLEPSQGEVDRPERTILLFQEDALLDHRDAIGNVLLPFLPKFGLENLDAARTQLRQWGLEGHEHAFMHELSGGMKKRLSMARAWNFQPECLLLDEPFVNLDLESRSLLWNKFFEMLPQIPCLIITHYPEELENFPVEIVEWSDLTNPQ